MADEFRPEVVIGLVAPTGTNLDAIANFVEEHARAFGYTVNQLRLSEVAIKHATIQKSAEHDDISWKMDAGNELRKRHGRGDALILHGIAELVKQRRGLPRAEVLHLIRSLKHPREVETLRRVYGTGFFLMGVYASEARRKRQLIDRYDVAEDKAIALMARDQKEQDELGQKTRDTFHLADFFVEYEGNSEAEEPAKKQIERFIDLIFGQPHTTPTSDEHAMFLAYASSLRSGDLARQVGSVVLNSHRDVVATGANDVPAFEGGLQWPGTNDHRDHVKGYDFNDRRKNEIARDLLDRLALEQNEDVLTKIRGSLIFDITEYGRAVHAEMEALLAAARNGASIRGGTLFTTTFPCHNCAKHIIAVGVLRVVYVEPYPKSLAGELYPDEISVDEKKIARRVNFEPYIGVGPRWYVDLFSMSWGSGRVNERKQKHKNGEIVLWQRKGAVPRMPLEPQSFIQLEEEAVNTLSRTEQTI